MRLDALRTPFVALSLFASACSPRPIGPPPDAPIAVRPLDAMPADLDLVLRLDLHKMRETLGATAMTAINERAVSGLRGADSATDKLLLDALANTDTLWLGVRPTSTLDGADNVFVLSGRYPGFDPHRAESTPRFSAGLDLGADLRRYDREKSPPRSAPARFYVRGEDLIVSLSEAEIDSVERSFEEQRGLPALEPAEKGVLSAVARPRVLPTSWFLAAPALRRLAEHAERLELTADLSGAGVAASLALRFEDDAMAERVSAALEELRSALDGAPGRLAKFASKLRVSHAGRYVTLDLAIGRDELSELVNCRGSACAW